jgi:hypothetical protein
MSDDTLNRLMSMHLKVMSAYLQSQFELLALRGLLQDTLSIDPDVRDQAHEKLYDYSQKLLHLKIEVPDGD